MGPTTYTLISMAVVFIFIIVVLILALCIIFLRCTRMNKPPPHLQVARPVSVSDVRPDDRPASETQNLISPSCPPPLFTQHGRPANGEIADTGNVQHKPAVIPSLPQRLNKHRKAFLPPGEHLLTRMSASERPGPGEEDMI